MNIKSNLKTICIAALLTLAIPTTVILVKYTPGKLIENNHPLTTSQPNKCTSKASECPICTEFSNSDNPSILPFTCEHSICQNCFNQIKATSKEGYTFEREVSIDNDPYNSFHHEEEIHLPVRCPICRADVK